MAVSEYTKGLERVMYVIRYPKCGDLFEDNNYTKCKCFRCGNEYKPSKVFVPDYIWQAMKRVKGG